MKIPVIKILIETHPLPILRQLQEELENEKPLSYAVEGEDEGEQLTHILGAIWILESMEANGTTLPVELRNFTSRVRTSIS